MNYFFLSLVALLEANRAAEAVFDDVLGNKDRADATRNALGVLNRFKLLFYLPSTIEKNIQKVRQMQALGLVAIISFTYSKGLNLLLVTFPASGFISFLYCEYHPLVANLAFFVFR